MFLHSGCHNNLFGGQQVFFEFDDEIGFLAGIDGDTRQHRLFVTEVGDAKVVFSYRHSGQAKAPVHIRCGAGDGLQIGQDDRRADQGRFYGFVEHRTFKGLGKLLGATDGGEADAQQRQQKDSGCLQHSVNSLASNGGVHRTRRAEPLFSHHDIQTRNAAVYPDGYFKKKYFALSVRVNFHKRVLRCSKTRIR